MKQLIKIVDINLTNKDVDGELRKMLDIGSTMLAKKLNQQRKELNEEFERELEQKLEQNTEDVTEKSNSNVISALEELGYSDEEILKVSELVSLKNKEINS